ncbi:hypothetical protein Bca101_057549 [Brassica carinata]
MLMLQRWEPSLSPSFPNQIPFWIQVQGIPLHPWTEIALTTLAEDIGILDLVEITSTKARMRVFVDGLKPLTKKATLEYASGEEVETDKPWWRPPQPPPVPTIVHNEAFIEAVSEVRQVMSNYANCADPSESAARKERVRQEEEAGEMEETAVLMLSEINPITPPPSNLPLFDPIVEQTPPRIPARLRLGPIREEEEDVDPPPLIRSVGANKRRSERTPSRRITPSPLNFLGVGVKRRVIAKTQPSPLKHRNFSSVPRLGENLKKTSTNKKASTSTSTRKNKSTKGSKNTLAASQRNSRADFRDPSSPLP